MESTDSSSMRPSPQLPPGFRFHPTDEELLIHYLRKKAASVPLPVPIIADIDLYKFDPWELPGMASFGEHEWYFFSQRDRKYPNGARPNRTATSGYWKATGTDKPVMTQGGRHKLGVKKALVFYGGKPPKGIKTNWIMHEYRLAAADHNNINTRTSPSSNHPSRPNSRYCFHPSNKKPLSLRLDDWVLCRIYHKSNSPTLLAPENQRDHHDHASSLLPIPPGLALPAPSRSTALHNDDHFNLFHGLAAAAQFQGLAALNTTELAVPMKRTFPFLYWSNGTASAGSPDSPARRFHEDYNNQTSTEDESSNGTSSIHTTLLNQQVNPQERQCPSSLSQQQAAMLGSVGNGVLRHPVNSWYT